MRVRPEDTLINTVYPFCRGRILHIVEKDEGQYDTPARYLMATGACLFVRTATYKEVGGLDDRISSHIKKKSICVGVYVPGDIGWYASHNPSFTMSVEPP